MQKKLLLFLTVLLFPWAMKAQTNFHEGFESGIPSTWTNIDSDNDGYNWVRASVLLAGETISPHDGTDFVCSQSYDENDGDLTPDNWLVTPAITVGTAEVLTYYVAIYDSSYAAEHYGVYISTTSPTNISSFTLLHQETLQSQNIDWTERTIDLSAYAGQTVYIAFRHFNCNDEYYLFLDDVTVGPAPTCFPVVNVTASNVTENSADIAWIDTVNATPYAYQVEVNGQIEEAYANPYTLTNLNSFTAYTVRVRPICTVGDTASWSAPVSFMTQMGAGMNTSVVANGTVVNEYVPVYGWYADDYLKSQTIYPSSMLADMVGATVSAMAFHLSSNPTSQLTSSFVVKLTEVTQSSFPSSSSSFLGTTNANMVYTGTLSFDNNLLLIVFNTPYTYNGGNLLLEIYSTTVGNYAHTEFLGVTAMGGSMQGYDSDLSFISPSVMDFIPKTTFFYTGGATCLIPNDLHIDSVTTTSAEFSWTPREAGMNYEVYLAPAGTVVDWNNVTWTSVSTDTSYTFTGLTPFTDYTAYVRTDCGSEYSVEVSVDFRTLADCSNITLPYNENFNSYTNVSTGVSAPSGFPNVDYPVCWTILNNVSSTSDYPQMFLTSYNIYAVTGNSLFFKSSTSTPAYAILPEMPSSIDGLQMTFTYRNEGTGSSNGTLHVGYMTSLTDANTFVSLYTCPQTTTLTEVDITFDTIQVNPNDNYYIAFKYVGGSYSNYYLSIDNVEVSEIPTCMKPASLTVTGSSSNSVTLSWTEVGTATSWNVVYGPVGFIPDTVVNNIEYVSTTPTVTVNNLTGGTSYEFYVQADCGGDVSSWRGPVMATPGTYNMGTSGWDTLYTCGSVIYDNGGTAGNYSSNCNATLTIYPATPGAMVMITGTSSTESCCDYLQVFDGATTSGTPLAEYKGENLTVNCISTSGPLTLFFYSDGSLVKEGFALNVSCISCLTPQLSVGTVGMDEVTVNWSDNSGGQATYEIVYGPAGFNPDTVTPEQATGLTSYTMTNLTSGTTYDVYFRVQCDDGTYAPWKTTTVTTLSSLAAPVPYTCDFEDATENAAWTLVNGSQTNKWYIGGAVHSSGDSALYISNNNGLNNEYNNTSTSVVWAYRDIAFDNSSGFNLSFDWRCNGESTFDYLEVYLAAPATVTAGTETAPSNATLLGRFNQDSVWRHEEFTISSQYANTTQRLYFLWKNDYSQGDFPAAAIDNITVTGMTCGNPYNLALGSTTSSSATVHFTPASINDANWEMLVLAPNDTIDASQAISLSDTTYELTNLATAIQYRVYVRTDCGSGDYSMWVGPLTFALGSYNMGTSGWDTLYTCGAVIYDNGGLTGNYADNTNAYLVLYPDQPGSFVQVYGTLVAESSTWDYLIFYDGVGTANEILKTNQTSSSQTYTIPTITSSTGPLTIYFRSDNSNNYQGYEIFTTCVNCVSPSMSVTNLTSTGVTLDWSGFLGSQTNFEIVYGAPTINPDNETPVTVSNVTSYSISGLTPATAYVAYIRSDCGDGTYSNWNMVSFTTECTPISTLPYAENFDTYASGGMPTCWKDLSQGSSYAQVSTSYNVSAPASLSMYLSSNGDLNIVTLPEFDNTINLNTLQLSMQTRFSYSDGTLLVGTMTDNTNASTFVPYDTITVSSGNTWESKVVRFDQYSGNAHTIAFKYECNDYNYAYFDDILVDVIPVCAAVSNLDTLNVTTTFATIIWTPGDTETDWNLQYKTASGDWSNSIAVTGTPSHTLTGLTANTQYQVRVQAVCDTNNVSDWSAVMTFKTAEEQQQETCPSPTNVTATNITESSANISWTQQGDVTSWDVNYRVAGATSWNTTTTSSNPHTLTGLTPETSYEVQVIAHCTNGVTSDPSTTITFTTNPDGIDDHTLDNTVTVYPNPTTGLIQIENGEWRMENVEVYDAYGKLLNTMIVNDHTVNLDLSGYAKGTYFVRVTTEKGVVTKRVVKN